MSVHNAVLPLTPTAVSLLNDYKDAPSVRMQYEISELENLNTPYSLSDPIGDEPHTVTKGLVHRYTNRVLLKVTDQCAAYCRFCFRKDMLNGGDGVLKNDEITQAITYIQNHREIEEVIFSGGDPFILSNRRLHEILDQIKPISHISKIRFHTRMPLIKPSRIDDELSELLREIKQEVRVVLHINHADELTASRIEAIKTLSKSNVALLSQTVFLKNINNSAKDLDRLFTCLDSLAVRPYYIHHLDKAYGTDHFRISIKEGQKLMMQIKSSNPAYNVPDYMIDIPGGFGKRSLFSEFVTKVDNQYYLITDNKGRTHTYLDEAA